MICGHADAGDHARCADGARADADLHAVGARLDQRARAFARRDVAGDKLQLGVRLLDLADRFDDAVVVAVRGVEHDDVDLRLDERCNAVEHVGRRADRRAAEQAAAGVARGIRVLHGFLDVLDRDEALEVAGFIDDRQLFDAVPAQDLLRVLQRGADRRGDEVFLRHDVGDLLVEVGVGHEAQVAVRDDADELAILADRHAGDLVAAHQVVGLAHRVLRREVERVDDDAVFRALDHIDEVCLALDRHILVDDADTALTRDRDGHLRLGDGIHRRRHDRGIEPDLSGELRGNIHLCGQHVRFCGDQQNIVKGQPSLTNLEVNSVFSIASTILSLFTLLFVLRRAAKTAQPARRPFGY